MKMTPNSAAVPVQKRLKIGHNDEMEMEEEVVEFAPRDGNFDWRDATGYAGTAGDDPRGLKVNRFTREGEEEEYSRKY